MNDIKGSILSTFYVLKLELKGSDFVSSKIRNFWFGFRTLKTYSDS